MQVLNAFVDTLYIPPKPAALLFLIVVTLVPVGKACLLGSHFQILLNCFFQVAMRLFFEKRAVLLWEPYRVFFL